MYYNAYVLKKITENTLKEKALKEEDRLFCEAMLNTIMKDMHEQAMLGNFEHTCKLQNLTKSREKTILETIRTCGFEVTIVPKSYFNDTSYKFSWRNA